jgi:hypothetical protein
MNNPMVQIILKSSNPREKTWFVYKRKCDLSNVRNYPFVSGEEDTTDHSILWHPAYDNGLQENGDPILREEEIRTFCEKALDEYER